MSSRFPAEYCQRSAPARANFGRTQGLRYLPDGIPITGVAGDQQASLVGQGCFEAGQAKCTYGTGAFLLAHTGGRPVPSGRGLITTRAASLGDEPAQYALEGSVFIAGAAVQWFRDGLEAIGAAPEIGALALEADPASEVTFVPALTGLGAPHWEPAARGTIFGLTRATSLADVARATLEGVAFQIADLIEAIQEDLGSQLSDLRVDGGMARSDPFLQFQADVLGQPIRRSPQTESTALGAALLAGLGVGLWPDRDRASELLQSGGQTFQPKRDYAWRAKALERWRRAVETVIGHYRKEAAGSLLRPGAASEPTGETRGGLSLRRSDPAGQPEREQGRGHGHEADLAEILERALRGCDDDLAADERAQARGEVLDGGIGAHEAAPPARLDAAGDDGQARAHPARVAEHQGSDHGHGKRQRHHRQVRHHQHQHGGDRRHGAINRQLAETIGQTADQGGAHHGQQPPVIYRREIIFDHSGVPHEVEADERDHRETPEHDREGEGEGAKMVRVAEGLPDASRDEHGPGRRDDRGAGAETARPARGWARPMPPGSGTERASRIAFPGQTHRHADDRGQGERRHQDAGGLAPPLFGEDVADDRQGHAAEDPAERAGDDPRQSRVS